MLGVPARAELGLRNFYEQWLFVRDIEDLDERLKTTAGILRNLVRIAEGKKAAA